MPIQLLHRVDRVTVNANQGWMDIPKQIFYLTGAVQGIGQRNQALLTSNQLTWFIPTRDFIAEGDVFYQQQNPSFTSTGPTARGKFQDQRVMLSGGTSNVVTHIIPE
ncbi:LPS export ABC transporter periplasmic protein LptC [Neosynechococcus sphagnicola]|uniref:LPS export ABC transporter periplasmic protein LptC n=1 Tax=Neosynechococcus sphagnicola TaxID=1501145 RepID=UPI00068AAB9F|nr:LPS export ABC transporter periplasmic protein LptC [Neosynechococcus sphagnicola]